MSTIFNEISVSKLNLADMPGLDTTVALNVIEKQHKGGNYNIYLGDTLITLNPFTEIPLYDAELTLGKYKVASNVETLDPHPFAITRKAVDLMKAGTHQQTILGMGISNSGKSYNEKLIGKYLTAGNTDFGSTLDLLGQAEMILAAFGNARTSNNNDSSRFIKRTRFIFNNVDHSFIGLNVECFNLEINRLTDKSADQDNFHLLRHICDDKRALVKLGLNPQAIWKARSDGFQDLSSTTNLETLDKSGMADHPYFFQVLDALGQFLEPEEVKCICRTLAIIILMNRVSRDGVIEGVERSLIRQAEEILGCAEGSLLESIKMKTFPGSLVDRNKGDVERYLVLFQKICYTGLWEFIQGKITAKLGGASDQAEDSSFIDVIDNYGLEDLDTSTSVSNNSLSQFIINEENEQMIDFFYHYNISRQLTQLQNDYADGIEPCPLLSATTPNTNNKATIDYLHAIGRKIDDAVANRGSTPRTLSTEIAKIGKPTSYKTFSTDVGTHFTVHHYASRITYSTMNMATDNASEVFDDPRQFLTTITDEGIRAILPVGKITKTLLAESREKIENLISPLRNGQPVHVIMSVASNKTSKYGVFNRDFALAQLEACGVGAIAKIRQEGFAASIDLKSFAERFGMLWNDNPLVEESMTRSTIEKNLRELFGPAAFWIGAKMIHFNTQKFTMLEKMLENKKRMLREEEKANKSSDVNQSSQGLIAPETPNSLSPTAISFDTPSPVRPFQYANRRPVQRGSRLAEDPIAYQSDDQSDSDDSDGEFSTLPVRDQTMMGQHFNLNAQLLDVEVARLNKQVQDLKLEVLQGQSRYEQAQRAFTKIQSDIDKVKSQYDVKVEELRQARMISDQNHRQATEQRQKYKIAMEVSNSYAVQAQENAVKLVEVFNGENISDVLVDSMVLFDEAGSEPVIKAIKRRIAMSSNEVRSMLTLLRTIESIQHLRPEWSSLRDIFSTQEALLVPRLASEMAAANLPQLSEDRYGDYASATAIIQDVKKMVQRLITEAEKRSLGRTLSKVLGIYADLVGSFPGNMKWNRNAVKVLLDHLDVLLAARNIDPPQGYLNYRTAALVPGQNS